jgi:hypothetical protein
MATLSIEVNASIQLVKGTDKSSLQRKYVLISILGKKDQIKCEDFSQGQGDTAWGKLEHIRRRSSPQEVRQADFIKQQGGAFIIVRV